jgi:hypothetical protein
MAIAFGNAAQVLACQNVRDKAIAVEDDFQFAAESNSCVPRTVDEMQADVDALIVALAAAGAGVTGSDTSALVADGTKVNAGSVTGTGNFATFTVDNGVITAITLSAS